MPDVQIAPVGGLNNLLSTMVLEESAEGLIISPPKSSLFIVTFLVVWCLFWDIGCVTFVFRELGPFSSSGSDRPSVEVIVLLSAIWIVSSLYVFNLLFVRRDWMFGPGFVARRTRLVGGYSVSEQRHSDVQRIELRYGTWKSGKGHTNILRYRTRGRLSPIELTGIISLPRQFSRTDFKRPIADGGLARPKGSGMRDFKAALDYYGRVLEAEMTEHMTQLGRLIAERVGVPFIRVEEIIPDPPSD